MRETCGKHLSSDSVQTVQTQLRSRDELSKNSHSKNSPKPGPMEASVFHVEGDDFENPNQSGQQKQFQVEHASGIEDGEKKYK